MSVWGYISAHMKQQKITAAELSRMTGIKQSSITGWKKGEYEPSKDAILKISEALSIPIDSIYSHDKKVIDSKQANEFVLDSEESKLIQALRRADPPVRTMIYKMMDAVLVDHVHTPKLPSASFLAQNDGSGSHKKRRVKGLKHVEGNAAAGKPITAVKDNERFVSVPTKYLSDRFFIVCAQGDSMIDVGINDGDFCIFQKDAYLDEGKIVLAQIDGMSDEPDVTIKRVFFHDEQIELRSENEAYAPMFFPASDVNLVGVLVEIVTPEIPE